MNHRVGGELSCKQIPPITIQLMFSRQGARVALHVSSDELSCHHFQHELSKGSGEVGEEELADNSGISLEDEGLLPVVVLINRCSGIEDRNSRWGGPSWGVGVEALWDVAGNVLYGAVASKTGN